MKPTIPVYLLATTVFLGGCEFMQIPRELVDREASHTGAGTLIKPETFEPIDLVRLLDPDLRGNYTTTFETRREEAEKEAREKAEKRRREEAEEGGTASTGIPVVNTPEKGAREGSESSSAKRMEDDKGARIDIAFRAFLEEYDDDLELRRNAVQEHILAASNQRCGYFENYLHQTRAGANFILGSLATIAGTVGAIVTGADTSRAFSGASGIFTGVRAEFNQELFANLATNVITAGIKLRRQQVYNQIALQGQAKSYDEYTVQAAVKDALYYHSQCSVISGLEVAADSIELSKDPGIDAANRVLAKLTVTRKLLRNKNLTPQEAVEVLTGSRALLQAGTPIEQVSILGADPLRVWFNATAVVKRENEEIVEFLDALLRREQIESGKHGDFRKAVEDAHECAETKLTGLEDEATSKTKALAKARTELREASRRENESEAEILQARLIAKAAKADADTTSLKIEQISSLFETHLTEAEDEMEDYIKEEEEKEDEEKKEKITLSSKVLEDAEKALLAANACEEDKSQGEKPPAEPSGNSSSG